jgi:hypothetical protein
MLDELKKVVLTEYNKGVKSPVNEFDPSFKAYLIGVMSMMITSAQYKDTIKRWKKLNED